MTARRLASSLIALAPVAALLGLGAPAPDDGAAPTRVDPPAATAAEAPPVRVVVRPSHSRDVGGTVELEDDEVIVVRTPDGRLETFAKGRVIQIMRLVDDPAGRTAVVFLADGSRRRGILLDDAFDHVRLEIAGVISTIPRRDVAAMTLEPSFEEIYASVKAGLDRALPEPQLRLAEWLFAERRFDLARDELRDLLSRFDHGPARRLLGMTEAQLALEAERAAKARRAAEGEAADDATSGTRTSAPHRVLTDAEVNLIRVYEIDFDRPPRVTVPRTAIQKLLDGYASSDLLPSSEADRQRLFRADPLQIVRLMFELRARELYPEVMVRTEPFALNLFRERVHDAWLVPNCATSRCHGGPDAGRLALISRNARDARVRYTNFLTLERLRLDDQEWPLLNYQRWQDSLVLQHAIPRSVARKPHPEVDGWTPAIQRLEDQRISDFAAWIAAMFPTRPDYPIEFDPQPTPGWTRDRSPDDADPSEPHAPPARIDR